MDCATSWYCSTYNANLIESKCTSRRIILGKDMNSIMTKLIRLLRVSSLAIWLALSGFLSAPLHAQDVKVNIGGNSAEQAKADKELADKLPPDQAAAYLKHRDAWSTVSASINLLAVLALPIGIVAVVLAFRHRRQKLAHETMRLMIAKGLPVPSELINPPPPAKPPKSDLRRGLLWLAIGVGASILLKNLVSDEGVWTAGLVPAFMGVAYLLCWGIGLAQARREGERPGGGLWPGIFWTLFGVSLALAMRSLNRVSTGDWDEAANWWGVSFIPIGIGVAFLLHALVSNWIDRKRTTQG